MTASGRKRTSGLLWGQSGADVPFRPKAAIGAAAEPAPAYGYALAC